MRIDTLQGGLIKSKEIMERKTERLSFDVNETMRPVSPGAEKRLGEILPILDYGFVYLVDYMGNDQSIEQAARVSYGSGTRKVNETKGLIRYLMRHEHTTPFEMVELKFHAKMPIFVARQWVRHRTASINEYSGRYSILDKEFYIPEPEVIAHQSKSNKQGRGEVMDAEKAEAVRQILIQDAVVSYDHYKKFADDGVAKELARIGLSVDFYTQWYWKCNLHNLFHFLKLRMDPHAQWEIRQYANAMAEITKDVAPIAYEAFEDFELNAMNLTGPEKKVLAALVNLDGGFLGEEVLDVAKETGMESKGELTEMIEKFKNLGLIK